MMLNLDDYPDVMSALHKILTETPLNEQLPYDLPPFTEKQLKAGLRKPWTAEQIGRLLVKYESEWYADESLSKWNEIDSLYQKQYDQKKQSIADELTQANITKPAERDYAMQILDKSYQQQTDEWQIEKQQRIKPSLWWSEVAKGQAAQAVQASTKTEGNADKAPEPVLSNLCANGTVWHFHPVGMAVFIQSDNIDCNAKFKKISRVILQHEGGYVDDPNDSGGATNKGIAWNTWLNYAEEDLGVSPTLDNLKAITNEQAEIIYRKRYWQPRGFCKINNDRVGLMIYDWTITSGGAAKQVQQLLVSEFSQSISIDGGIGAKTIDAINSVEDQQRLLERIAQIRKDYYTKLAIKSDGTHTKNYVFLSGWLSRVDDCLTVKIDD